MTAKAVIAALDFSNYVVTPIYITLDGEWVCGETLQAPVEDAESLRFAGTGQKDSIEQFVTLASNKTSRFDVVFPVLHGPNGEDGTIQCGERRTSRKRATTRNGTPDPESKRDPRWVGGSTSWVGLFPSAFPAALRPCVPIPTESFRLRWIPGPNAAASEGISENQTG